MEPKIDVPSIKLSYAEKVLASVRNNIDQDDADLSFEFILMSFFPVCWRNVQKELDRQYTLGFIAGSKQKEENFGSFEESDECYDD